MLFDPRDTDVISAAIFDEAQRGSGRDRLRNALAATTGTDPAEEALRQRLSKRLGVSVVDTKPAQQMADTDDIVSAIRAESATGRWLSQPENAAVARKDYTRLQALEEAYRRTRLIRDPAEREQRRADVANELMGMAGTGSYFASQGRSLLSGGTGIAAVPYDMVDVVGGAMGLGKEAADVAAFVGTTPQASAIMSVSGAASAKTKQLREGMRVTPDVLVKNPDGSETINWRAMAPTNAGGWENIVNAVTQEAIPTVVQWLLGLATAPETGFVSVAPAVATTAKQLGKLRRIAAAAWRYAKSPVSAVNAARVIQGQYQQGVQELMAEGLSETEARQKAAPGALLAGVMSPVFGGWAEAKIMEDLATRVAKTSDGFRLGARILAYSKSAAATGMKEGLQELSEGIGEDLASMLTYKPDMGWRDFAADAIQNFVGGVAIGGPMGTVGQGRASIRAAQMAQFVEALGSVSKAAEFARVAPEKMGEFVAHLTKDGPLENLFVDGQTWERFWQGKGMDPRKEAERLGVRPEDYAVALAANADIVLSTPAVAELLAPTEHFGEILADLKTRMGGPTIAEEQNLRAASEGVQRQLAELEKSYQEHPELHDEVEKVADLMEKELEAANKLFDAGARRDIAEAHARVIGALAARTGGKLSPMQLYEKEKLNIKREVYDPLSAMGIGPRRISPLGASAMSLLRRSSGKSTTPQDTAPTSTEKGPRNPAAASGAQAAPASNGPAGTEGAASDSAAPGPIKEAPVEGSAEGPAEGSVEPVSDEAARGLSERLGEAFREAGIDISGMTDEDALDELQRWLTESRLEQALSTRVPSAVGVEGRHLEELLLSNYAAMRESPDHLRKAVEAVSGYPGVSIDTSDPEKGAEKFIQHVTENLLALFDAMPKSIRDEAKQWYVGANRIAKEWAEKNSLELSQVAAIIAALSPKNEWFQNLEAARLVIQTVLHQQGAKWDQKMDEVADGTESIAKEKELPNVRGKKLGELKNDRQRAIWIRSYIEAYSDKQSPVMSPSGEPSGDVARNKNGSPTTLVLPGFDALTKAVGVLRGASKESLDAAVGKAHKVRNFYNNIFDPDAPDYVTIDTHAVGAGLLLPRGQNSTEVKQVFGPGGGAGSSTLTGMGGTYGLFHEAYTRAAKARGVLPREMQSITWEAVRGLFKPAQRRDKEFVAAVDKLWARFASGKASRSKTIKEVFKLAGGIDAPSWYREPASTTSLMSELDAQKAELHVNAESMPGEGFTPEVTAALLDAKSRETYDYHVEKMAIVESTISKHVEGVLRSDGVGYWKGQTNESTSFRFKPQGGDVDAAAAALAALAWATVRDQDAVGWNTVHVAKSVDEANGMLWEFPRPLTRDEALGVLKEFDTAGLTEIGFVDATDLSALRVIIFDFDSSKAADIHTKVVEAFNRSLPDGMTGHRALLYKAGSNLVGKDNYHEHLNAPTAASIVGSPSGVKRSSDAAHRRIQRLNRKTVERIRGERLFQRAPRFNGAGGGRHPIEVHGAHYSVADSLTELDAASYGSGSPGAEGLRLKGLGSDDPLRRRVYFYATEEGKLPRKEPDVRGLNVYDAVLSNVYDAEADREGLLAGAEGDANAFERAVIAAGYSGYRSPRPGKHGSVVLLGDQKVPVRSLGRVSLEQARGSSAITLDELRELRGGDSSFDVRLHQGPATLHPVDPASPAFSAWFGEGSNLVNEDGTPMRLYHGTDSNFTRFRESKSGAMGRGIYLGQDPEASEGYGDRMMIVYARGRYLSNAEWTDYVRKFGWANAREEAQKDGWAGVRDDRFESAVCVWDPRNIKSAMSNTGKFSGRTSEILFQSAYHGSPFNFDSFSLEHIGEGEGAQAYGWGLYFASKRDIANYYRETLSGVELYDGKPLEKGTPKQLAAECLLAQQGNLEEALDDIRYMDGTPAERAAVRRELLKLDYSKLVPSKGQLYHVDIPDGGYLKWERRLGSQPGIARNLEELAGLLPFDDRAREVFGVKSRTELVEMLTDDEETGHDLYIRLRLLTGSPKAASLLLRDAGFSGISYYDGVSRNGHSESENFVVFDESAVKVLETFYQGLEPDIVHGEPRMIDGAYSHDITGATLTKPRKGQLLNAEPEGIYTSGTAVVKAGMQDIGLKKITSIGDAARAMAYMSSHVVEHLDALVVGKDGSPLAIVGAFKGGPASVSTPVLTVLAEAVRVEGAASVWLAHNHPSGNTTLSDDDKETLASFVHATEGTGIEVRGILAVGEASHGSSWSGLAQGADAPEVGKLDINYTKAKTVPVLDRRFTKKNGSLAGAGAVTSPRAVVNMLNDAGIKGSGVLWLSGAHVTGFTPVDAALAKRLRSTDNPTARALWMGASYTGASHAVLVSSDGALSERSISNVAGFLNSSGIGVVDAVEVRGGELDRSWAVAGKSVSTQSFSQGVDYPRGYLEPGLRGSSRKMNLALLDGADKSTVFHELGHYYLEVMGDLVDSGDADESLRRDYATILKWFGVESRADITTEMHEKFADGHLVYLRDGKAPLPELRAAFRRFSRWLKKIGERLLGTDVKLTPEVRDVFDRLYAAEEAIDLAMQSARAGRFSTAEEAGMTEAQFESYRKRLENLALDAHDKVMTRIMKAEQEKLEQEWKAEFEQRKAAAMEELQKEPGRVAAEMMRANTIDGETETDLKLNYLQTLDALGRDVVAALPEDLVVDEGGIDPDSAAALFGFRTADELAQALIGMKPLEQAAEERATEAMRAEHGDLVADRDALHAVALAEANSEAMTDVIASELRAMLAKSKKGMDRKTYVEMVAAMGVFAKKHVGAMEHRKVNPNTFLLAAKKAGNDAYRAAKRGKVEEAAELKKKELLNQHLYRAAVESKELGERFRSFVKRSDKATVRKKMARAGKGYLAAFDKVRDLFSIERVPNKVLDAEQSFAKWAEERRADGDDVILDAGLFSDGEPRNYRTLTTDQLSSLYDTLRNLKHLAYRELEEVIEGKRVEREQMIDELEGAIRAAGPSKRIPLSGSAIRETVKFKASAALAGFDATLLKIEQLVNWIDGDDVKGPAHRYIWNRIAAAQTAEYDYHAKVTRALSAVLERMPKEMRHALTDTFTVDGFPEPVSRKQALTMLFYMGQEERRSKLMGGFARLGIGEDAVLRAVGKLKPEEARFVNDVWAELDTMWADIAGLEERLTGVAPKKQDNIPFTLYDDAGRIVAHMTGGYFPLVADPDHTGELSKKQEGGTVQQVLAGNGYARAATSTGHVKELTGKVYPLLLDFEHTLTAHMTNVIKDLTHREVVLSVNRIFQDDRFSTAVKEVFGVAYEAQLMPWLVNVVKDHNVGSALGLGAWHKAMSVARGNTVAAMLAFKFSTVIVQVTDFARLFAPGDYRVKPLRFASAMAQVMAHPVKTAQMIYELSGEMRHRAENLDRDLRSAYEELQGNASLRAKWNRWGFKALGIMDKMTSLPAWLAAYQGAMKEHGDVDRAVLEADRTVRLRLMTGNPKDLIAAQRNDGLMKLLTMFMGDATANYNMLRNAGHSIHGLRGIPSFTMTALIVAMSSVVGDLVKGQGPDDDDDLVEWLALKASLAPFSTVPVVRDLANVVEGRVLGKPFSSYRFTPAVQAIQKTLDLIPSTVELAKGEREWGDWSMAALESLGYAFGIGGTSQIIGSAKYFRRYAADETDDTAPEAALNVIRAKGGKK